MRVLVAGAASWNTVLHLDRLPDPRPHTVFARAAWDAVGGTSAGKALNLARLGHEVHLHVLLGDDDPGRRVRAVLEGAGVHVHADADAVGTEQHVNLMAADGGRLSVYRHAATPRDDLDLRPVADLAATCDVVVVDIADHARALLPLLAERGTPFWTDLHDWDGDAAHHRDFASAADHVVLSHDALEDPAPLCARLAEGGRTVVCTRGAQGATAWVDGTVVEVDADPVEDVVDTNGAGDAFTAGLLHGLHEGWTTRRALRAGAVAGATAVRSRALASPLLTARLLRERTEDGPAA